MFADAVDIYSNDPDEGLVSVGLSGEGWPISAVEERLLWSRFGL